MPPLDMRKQVVSAGTFSDKKGPHGGRADLSPVLASRHHRDRRKNGGRGKTCGKQVIQEGHAILPLVLGGWGCLSRLASDPPTAQRSRYRQKAGSWVGETRGGGLSSWKNTSFWSQRSLVCALCFAPCALGSYLGSMHG